MLNEKKPVMYACIVQFVNATSLQSSISFMPLFLYYDLNAGSLSEATFLWGTVQLPFFVIMCVAAVFWGWLSDKVSAEKMLIRVILSHSIVMGLIALSPNMHSVLVLRLFQGLAGGTSTMVMVLIAKRTKPREFTEAVGYQQMAQTMGFALGPAFGAVLASFLGFRPLFAISSILITASLVPVFMMYTDNPETRTIERIAVGIKGKKTLKDVKDISRNFISIVLVDISYVFIIPILPLYLSFLAVEESLLTGYTGFILMLYSLIYGISAAFMPRIIKRRHIHWLIVVISSAIFLQPLVRNLYLFVGLMAIVSMLYSAVLPHLFGDISSNRNKGVTMGIANSARLLGNGFGPFVASSTSYAFGIESAFFIVGLIVLIDAYFARQVSNNQLLARRVNTYDNHHKER